MIKTPRIARFILKYFELLSWIFFILAVVSTYYVIAGGINYYKYGSCNGLNQAGFCVFDPKGESNKISANAQCKNTEEHGKNLSLAQVNLSEFPTVNNDSINTLVFVGCYECDYSRKVYPTISSLVKKERVNYTFIHFPVKTDTEYLSGYIYCANSIDSQKFWTLNNLFFTADKNKLSDPNFADILVAKAGYNLNEVKKCLADPKNQEALTKQKQELDSIGIYGTPTIFINGTAAVGPKPYRVYKEMLKK